MKIQIANSLQILKTGGTFVYPTDTVWGIGCDATNQLAVSKIFALKNRTETKSLIVLVDSFDMLNQYISAIPDTVIAFLKTATKPTTIIYNNPKGLAKNVVAQDNSIAIRIVNDVFCQKLIQQFGKPIVSTSANKSTCPTPKSFKEIDTSLLNAVDYVVNLPQNESTNKPSSIIKIDKNGQLVVIRA